jgi:peptidoglycan/LPS O-acetylase OafA/YrhL
MSVQARPMAHPPPPGLLPGLHATAATMVVLYHLHAIPMLAVPAWLPVIATHFGGGVLLFFALSTFALAWSNPQAAARPWPYLTKRFFRIAPLYYLVLAAVLTRREWPGMAFGRRLLGCRDRRAMGFSATSR